MCNIGGFAIGTLCYMLITPFALGVLGKARFGVWALAGAVTSFAKFGNLGFDQGLVKFVAEFWAQKRVKDINKMISTVFACYIAIAGLIMSALLPLRSFIIKRLFHIPSQFQEEAFFVLTGVIVIFFFNLLFSVFRSALLGIQRMDITNGIFAVSRILSAIGIFFFLANGFGLKGLIINRAIMAFLIILADVFYAKRLIKGFKVRISLFSRQHLKRIFKFGMNISLASAALVSYQPVHKVALANFVSLSSIAFYEIGMKVQGMIFNFFSSALTPLLPASSEFKSHKDTQSLEKLYFTTPRVILLTAFPVFTIAAVMAVIFIELWLGEGYMLAARALQFILAAHFISLFVVPAYIISRGIGYPQLSAIASGAGAIVNLGVCIILAITIGYYGILIGILATQVTESALTIFLFHRKTKIPFVKFLKNMPLAAMGTTVILGGLTFRLSSYVSSWNFAKLIAISVSFLLIYAMLILKLGFADQRDRRMFNAMWKQFTGKRSPLTLEA